MSNTRQYFATLPPDEVTGELYSRIEDYFQELEQTGQLAKIRKSYRLYYNLSNSADQVREGGEQGELLEISVNHFKSVLSQIHTLITKERPALKAQAINSDSKSQAQARLGDSLLDYYLKTQDIEQALKDAAEMGLVMSGGYVVLRWNPNKGTEYGAIPETGAVVYDGDIEALAKSCLDVVHDIYSESSDWYVIIEHKNKWDLAAKFPELAEEIAGLGSRAEGFSLRDGWRLQSLRRQSEDLIPHYTFVHDPTPAVPNGRQVEFLEGDIVLTDGPLPYRDLPIIPIRPGRIAGTQLGDTVAFSLLAIQDVIDELYSAVVTNQSTFAVSNILAPKGADVDVHELAGGMNLIEYDGEEPPQALNLTATPPEVFKFIEQLQQQLQLLSGINDVVRGVAPQQLRSGSALALLAAQAVASQSGLNYSYNKLLERTGTQVINLLQDYAKTPRMAVIAGTANASYMTEFTGDDVAGVNRVLVEQQSSVMRTTAGRLELAENMLNKGMFKTPEAYLSVVETGNLSPLLQSETSELMLIERENEELRLGGQPQVVDVDSHDLHIRRHKQVIADPDVRRDPVIVAAVLAHIQEHITALKTVDPHLLSILKEQPAPQPQLGQQSSPKQLMTPQGQNQEDPNLPNLPIDPLTGQPFNPNV